MRSRYSPMAFPRAFTGQVMPSSFRPFITDVPTPPPPPHTAPPAAVTLLTKAEADKQAADARQRGVVLGVAGTIVSLAALLGIGYLTGTVKVGRPARKMT